MYSLFNQVKQNTDDLVIVSNNINLDTSETLNKYLLITCDSVLSGLARRLQFPHVIQIGNSINYFKYGTTSQQEQALSLYCSMKEKLKKEIEELKSRISDMENK